jgi:hypothetical protein
VRGTRPWGRVWRTGSPAELPAPARLAGALKLEEPTVSADSNFATSAVAAPFWGPKTALAAEGPSSGSMDQMS